MMTEALNPFKESSANRLYTVNRIESLCSTICNNHVENSKAHTISNTSFTKKASSFKYIDHYTRIGHDTQERYGLMIRSLLPKEIETLSHFCHCQADDWDSIYLMVHFDDDHEVSSSLINDDNDKDLSSMLKEQISDCSFRGFVVLGIISSSKNYKSHGGEGIQNDKTSSTDEYDILINALKPGIKNNTVIKDSIISPGARVYNNTLLSDVFIGPTSTIINCGSIHLKGNQTLVDVMDITVGPESGGGRTVNVKPESTLVEICDCLGISTNTSFVSKVDSTPITISINVVLGHLYFVQMGSNMFISESAKLLSCSTVSSIILLPEAIVKNSSIASTFLQWKCSIIDSFVSNTMLMECAAIGPNSTIASTVLGPDSHVSCGEVHCSVIGPNTNSHHQSLVISALWPMGRGNVGYGSNIGSNHTGRLPDQECTVGEGIFWGLGCVIKFPVDLSRSYYSVVAAGVELPPQSVSMPFSLITSGANGKNEIVPGWLLHSSPYTLLRSEDKFKRRRKAKRHDFYCDWRIVRPGIIDACWNARHLLIGLEKSKQKKRQLPQIGENILTERGQKVGIEAYTNIIQRYALEGLFKKLNKIMDIASIEETVKEISNCFIKVQTNDSVVSSGRGQIYWPIMPWEEESYNDEDKVTNHQLFVLSQEMSNLIESNSRVNNAVLVVSLLRKMISIEKNYFERVKKSKARDDNRGENTIPNYNEAHVLVSSDPVVKMAKIEMENVVMRCEEILNKLVASHSKL